MMSRLGRRVARVLSKHQELIKLVAALSTICTCYMAQCGQNFRLDMITPHILPHPKQTILNDVSHIIKRANTVLKAKMNANWFSLSFSMA
jgi:hypothetical protein